MSCSSVTRPDLPLPACPGQGVGVEDAVGLDGADHLAHADECRVERRFLADGEHTEDGPPGLADEHDPLGREALPQVVRRRDGVIDGRLQRVGVGRVERRVGRTRAALVERGHGEVLLEGGKVVAHGAELGPTGAAGEEEQDGVVGVVPPDHQPELAAVDVDRRQFGDAALHRLDRRPR